MAVKYQVMLGDAELIQYLENGDALFVRGWDPIGRVDPNGNLTMITTERTEADGLSSTQEGRKPTSVEKLAWERVFGYKAGQ